MTFARLLLAVAALATPLRASAQDAAHGKVVFEQCTACHSFDPTHNDVGPHLKGLFGRKSASVDDFTYSPALRRANITWTPELLDGFLKEPQAPPFRGNRMPFAGMADAKDRADLIAYLKEATKERP